MIKAMTPENPLEQLEATVLQRIADYRQKQRTSGSLPLDVSVAVLALAAGVMIGHWVPRHESAARGSEAVVLADDVRLAPSTLLASNP
jgi:hypothetical protein